MSEQFDPSPESREDLPELVFGDIITSKYSTYPGLIIELQEGSVGTMQIIDEANHQYGLAGTVYRRDIESVVGHKTPDEVVQVIARTMSQGAEPNQGILDYAQDYVRRYGPEQ